VKIARFEDKNGKVVYGVVSPCGCEAELISGDIFGKFTKTGQKAKVKKFLSPVDPPNVIAIGLNYRDHAIESGMAIPEAPVIFTKLTTSVIGPDDAIVRPKQAPNEVDYESELVIVIGKKAKDIEPGQANDYILGYTCGNDVSSRDCQIRIDKQWARGKSFDTFCPLGPWIVTPDELNPSDLAIKTFLNGQMVQNSRTSQLIFAVPELVSYLSKQFTLLPGTAIMTGTPPGVGFARKPAIFLKPGDEIVVDIQGIGQLKNSVI
jgi:2-keto-4-pentenoate hydratase/2-oxohepta-3-ene-1,7-dioic acid hydratase in catechol pathway